MIKKHGKKWEVVSHTDGRVLGTHDTERRAQAQLRAIGISKARAAGHRIPRKK